MASITAIPISAPAAGDNAVMSSNNALPIAAIDPAIPVFFDLFILCADMEGPSLIPGF
jgi:hypothetical protein